MPLMSVSNLNVSYERHGQPFRVLTDINFSLEEQQIVGIVGESGSGKSTLASVLMGLGPSAGATIESGSIAFKGEDLVQAPTDRWRSLRETSLGLILQDPHSSLNPALKVRTQLLEGVKADGKEERERLGLEYLRNVRLPTPEAVWRRYPHELSGGMKQRIVGAMGIANAPELLIADEPTTALDVTIQAQYLALLQDLRKRLALSIVLITHDLGVIAEVCDRVIVMYAGRIVEEAEIDELYDAPKHPYTRGLLESKFFGDALERTGKLPQIRGQPPRLWEMPPGCPFEPRCSMAVESCKVSSGGLHTFEHGRRVDCHVALEGLTD